MESTMSSQEAIAILGGFTGLLVLMLVLEIFYIVAYWKVFTKAGEAGWKSIIPFYNLYIMYKISWKSKMFWVYMGTLVAGGVIKGIISILPAGDSSAVGALLAILGAAVALVSLVIYLVQNYKTAKAYGHGIGFTLGLLFLNPLFLMILGLGSSKYEGAQS